MQQTQTAVSGLRKACHCVRGRIVCPVLADERLVAIWLHWGGQGAELRGQPAGEMRFVPRSDG